MPHAQTGFRRLRQRQNDAALFPHPRPGRGGPVQHPAGAGTVHLQHRGPHLPGTGRRSFRHGGKLFLYQSGRAHPLRRGRRGGADPFGRRPGRAGAPRTGRTAGQCALLLPPPPQRSLLPDGGPDHRRAEECRAFRHTAGRTGPGLRPRERQAERAGADLSGLRDAAGGHRHGPLRPAGAGGGPAGSRPCPGRAAGLSAGAGGVH